MAASSKIDLSSGSTDRTFYATTQRESLTISSMERSSSFRESSGKPVLSTLPSMARTGSAVTVGEVLEFVQNVHFDMKLVSGDNRCQRLMCSVVGVQPDNSSSGSVKGKLLPSSSLEDLKRAKAIVREGSIRARERLKIFHDTVSAFNKYLPNAQSRKRSRSEVLSTERSGSSSSGDRSLLGLNAGKRVTQGTDVSNVFEHGQQKSEERTKNDVPNKRTRTSLADKRADVGNFNLARPVESIERNRETTHLATSGPVSGDVISSVSVPGWEKSRLKKKRSAIKADGSSSAVSRKNNESCCDTKQGLQQRPVSNNRPRLQNSQSLRPGKANGTAKGDTSQQSSVTIGSLVPETDLEDGSLDWRDLNVSTNKERMNIKSINKPGSHNDISSESPRSRSKMNALARAPRSLFVDAPKSTPMVNRVPISNEWELSNCSNNLPLPFETSSRHASSARSSSPPAHWTGERSKKNRIPVRKSSFLSISPRNDDGPPSEFMSDVAGPKNGSEFGRRALGDSPKQIRLKGDHFSSTPLSESEDSANAEIKLIDKKYEEQGEKPGHHVQKTSTLVPPVRKTKLVDGEESRDVIRRQGRTVRGLAPGRSLLPMNIDKLASVGTAKQLRTAKLGLDKPESKASRQPSRKLSDRRAYTRQKHSALNSATDLLVGSEDCTEELVAAARAVINPCHAQSSAFWKQMEEYFRPVSDNDIVFLRQQENQGSFLLSPNAVNLDYSKVQDGCRNRSNGSVVCTNGTKYAEAGTDHFASPMRLKNEITLCQRLLTALIPEEETKVLGSESEDLIYETGLELDEGFGSNILNQYFLESFQLDPCTATDGHRNSSTRRPQDRPGHYMAQSPVTPMSGGTLSSYGHLQNGNLKTNEMVPLLETSDLEHDLDRRILHEIESAKLFSEGLLEITPPEEDEILADINCLVDEYHRQVVKKDNLLSDLLKFTTDAKEIQEKDFEARALDQLVGMSYGKYTASRRLRSSANSKVIKQAALVFVKRTLERCHTYEVTGTSCFSEPQFFDKFLSMASFTESQSADTATEGESTRPYDIISNGVLEPRASASIGSQQSPSLTSWSGHNLDNTDIYSSDMHRSRNYPSELTGNKDDTWSNSRVKKRELLLDEVGRSGISNALSSSTKGKRSERDKEGKGHGRDALYSHGTAKTGRPSTSNTKPERKPKAKLKQRTTQLSASVNDLLGKLPEQPGVSKSNTNATIYNGVTNEKERFAFDETEPIDLSGLQLPGIDLLGAPDDLDGQGEDIESWLNIEDDGLQDLDLMGLEIPMDDLSELNMMV